MGGPTSSWGSRNRITCLTLQERDDDDDKMYSTNNTKYTFGVYFFAHFTVQPEWSGSLCHVVHFCSYIINHTFALGVNNRIHLEYDIQMSSVIIWSCSYLCHGDMKGREGTAPITDRLQLYPTSRFTPTLHWVRAWVDPRASLSILERSVLPLRRSEPRIAPPEA